MTSRFEWEQHATYTGDPDSIRLTGAGFGLSDRLVASWKRADKPPFKQAYLERIVESTLDPQDTIPTLASILYLLQYGATEERARLSEFGERDEVARLLQTASCSLVPRYRENLQWYLTATGLRPPNQQPNSETFNVQDFHIALEEAKFNPIDLWQVAGWWSYLDLMHLDSGGQKQSRLDRIHQLNLVYAMQLLPSQLKDIDLVHKINAVDERLTVNLPLIEGRSNKIGLRKTNVVIGRGDNPARVTSPEDLPAALRHISRIAEDFRQLPDMKSKDEQARTTMLTIWAYLLTVQPCINRNKRGSMVTATCSVYPYLREYPWLDGAIYIGEAINELFNSAADQPLNMPSPKAVQQFVEAGLELEWLHRSDWAVRRNQTPLG